MQETNQYCTTITALSSNYLGPLFSFLAENNIFVFPATGDKAYSKQSEVSAIIIFNANSDLTIREYGTLIIHGFKHFKGLFFSISIEQSHPEKHHVWYGSNITRDLVLPPPKVKRKTNVDYLRVIKTNE